MKVLCPNLPINGHYVSVRGSYGIQGNIHDDATPNLFGSREQKYNK